MSISTTRKVDSSTTSSRSERNYAAGHPGSQFVEVIDTQNNVLVRDESGNHPGRQKYSPPQEDHEEHAIISPSVAYVKNNIEALTVSGAFDNQEDPAHTSSKVSIYDNNQSIIHDEELERTGRNYLKHFYEKNEHLIDVDEFI